MKIKECKNCGGIKLCDCDIIDTSHGTDSPQQIPNDQD